MPFDLQMTHFYAVQMMNSVIIVTLEGMEYTENTEKYLERP